MARYAILECGRTFQVQTDTEPTYKVLCRDHGMEDILRVTDARPRLDPQAQAYVQSLRLTHGTYHGRDGLDYCSYDGELVPCRMVRILNATE